MIAHRSAPTTALLTVLVLHCTALDWTDAHLIRSEFETNV